MITKLLFAMFLLKLSTLFAAIFLFVSLVLSLLFVYYIRMLCRHVCFVSNNVVADECDHDVLDQSSAMYGYPMYTTKVWRVSVVCTTNWCCKGNKIQVLLGQAFWSYFNNKRYYCKLRVNSCFGLKSQVIKVLFMKAVVLWLAMN